MKYWPPACEVIGLDNVGMDQVGNESCLTNEVALELCDRRIFFPDNFYRDDLPEIAGSKLHGLVDEAHAALRDLAGHLVVEFVEDVLKFSHGKGGRGRDDHWQERISYSARNLL